MPSCSRGLVPRGQGVFVSHGQTIRIILGLFEANRGQNILGFREFGVARQRKGVFLCGVGPLRLWKEPCLSWCDPVGVQ